MAAGFDLRASRLNAIENRLHEWRHSNATQEQAKANARAHYGLGEPFYRLWLDDPLLMYTCGYWPEGTATLEQAQRAKIDHVCRKIRLSPGERFVDIGCGFGGFMLRAHETTGASGVGVNTTTEQVDWLRAEIARRDLAGALSVREADFRQVDGEYDKVVSIGVLEHAGRDQLGEVIRAHAAFLKPGGLGMLHFIGHVGRYETELFIRKHVFPGGWIPSLADTIVEMERNGLEVVDIENLRRHYAPTLDAWAERFERRWAEIHALDPGALRRALPSRLAQLPGRLRRNVPLDRGLHPSLPDRLQQGQRQRGQLSHEQAAPVCRMSWRPPGAARAAARARLAPATQEPLGLAKSTSNLFRERREAHKQRHRPQRIRPPARRSTPSTAGSTSRADDVRSAGGGAAAAWRDARRRATAQDDHRRRRGGGRRHRSDLVSARASCTHAARVRRAAGHGEIVTARRRTSIATCSTALPTPTERWATRCVCVCARCPSSPSFASCTNASTAGAFFARLGTRLRGPAADFVDGVVFDARQLVHEHGRVRRRRAVGERLRLRAHLLPLDCWSASSITCACRTRSGAGTPTGSGARRTSARSTRCCAGSTGDAPQLAHLLAADAPECALGFHAALGATARPHAGVGDPGHRHPDRAGARVPAISCCARSASCRSGRARCERQRAPRPLYPVEPGRCT